jgi:serine/threonine-protein phosphatase 2A activator
MDAVAAVIILFPKCISLLLSDCRYFSLIRRLVETYTLEPAGSHGVWGLDDTSFLPFLLGSGQLKDQPSAPAPTTIMQPEIIQIQKEKNLYFAAIAWINKVHPMTPC